MKSRSLRVSHLIRRADWYGAAVCCALAFVCAGAGLARTAKADSDAPTQRPNIIYIMADDMGWGDSSITQQMTATSQEQTGWIETPCLREMAAAGGTFNRFYASSPKCSPTRAGMMTGRQHERQEIPNASAGHMRNGEITLAELAQSQGYTTAHFGKWHLGTLNRERFEFDGSRGGYGRSSNFVHCSTPWDNGFDVGFANERSSPTFNPYGSNSQSRDNGAARYWTSRTEAVLSPQRDGVPQNPRVMGDSSEILMNEAIQFIESRKESGEPFFANIWLSTVHKTITHSGGYRGAIVDLDTQIGRLRTYLAENGLMENTLIIFTSDNGSASSSAGRPDRYSGGLRGRKAEVFEGGIREPGLIEWHGVIEPGTVSHAALGVIDLIPTMLDLWNIEMPDDRPMDGESILPILLGETTMRQRTMMFYYTPERGRAIINPDGRYKVLSMNDGGTYQLYDLHADPTEENDLGNSDEPSGVGSLTLRELKAQMQNEWETWHAAAITSRTGVDYDYRVADSSALVRNEFDLAAEARHLVDLRMGQRENNTAELFVERQYATLRSPMALDSLGEEAAGLTTAGDHTLAKGNVVHSFLLHFDPVGTAEAAGEFSVTFDDVIVGVIGETEGLPPSDALAYSPPRYAGPAIGSEGGDSISRSGLEPTDTWEISADRKTITFQLTAEANDYDQVRILTESSLQGVSGS